MMKARLWELQKQKCNDALRSPEFGRCCTRNADAVCVTLYAQRARQLKLNGGTEEEEEEETEERRRRSRNV